MAHIYIVKTNFDWDPRDTSSSSIYDQLENSRDGFLGRRDLLGSGSTCLADFENLLKVVRPAPVLPCVDFQRDQILFRTLTTLSVPVGENISHEMLCDMITMKHPKVDHDYFRARLPPGFTHFDLLVNYLSNDGKYDRFFAELEDDLTRQDIPVSRVQLLRYSSDDLF